ncbi:hypothetical protein PIB30_047698 [Stylosanthes scabra]|uniref:Uncharacterized protein n=1 Tax=Stylosanthes scabra TaxID=79078 RepID=A0ABU6QIC5_9FABA|nr:hypothetical protein [Stylosanthes scabra]
MIQLDSRKNINSCFRESQPPIPARERSIKFFEHSLQILPLGPPPGEPISNGPQINQGTLIDPVSEFPEALVSTLPPPLFYAGSAISLKSPTSIHSWSEVAPKFFRFCQISQLLSSWGLAYTAVSIQRLSLPWFISICRN